MLLGSAGALEAKGCRLEPTTKHSTRGPSAAVAPASHCIHCSSLTPTAGRWRRRALGAGAGGLTPPWQFDTPLLTQVCQCANHDRHGSELPSRCSPRPGLGANRIQRQRPCCLPSKQQTHPAGIHSARKHPPETHDTYTRRALPARSAPTSTPAGRIVTHCALQHGPPPSRCVASLALSAAHKLASSVGARTSLRRLVLASWMGSCRPVVGE